MNYQERITRARTARFELSEVVLDVLRESDRPLQASEIGRSAGLGVFNTVATEGKRWAIIYGALDGLVAEGKVKKEPDGPSLFLRVIRESNRRDKWHSERPPDRLRPKRREDGHRRWW